MTPTTPRLTRPFDSGGFSLRSAAVLYLSAFILVPVVVITVQGVRFGFEVFWQSVTRPEAVAALWLSLWTSTVMTVINAVVGTATAYVLVRYRWPFKQAFNVLVDLPFAIPTLVTGVMLVILYGPQTVVGAFFNQMRFPILFAAPGIVLCLLFVGYPFVIRTVQPILLDMDAYQSEAAYTLGASEWQMFWRVVFPTIRPAILTGALFSFARSLGEFGAVIVVAGNIPFRSQTATVYVYTQVEAGNLQSASAVSLVSLAIAFIITIGVELATGRRAHA